MKKLLADSSLEFFSCFVASFFFVLLTACEILGFLFYTKGYEAAAVFGDQDSYSNCAKVTFFTFAFLLFVASPLLHYLIRFATVRLRVRYGLAFALLVLIIGLAFFVPYVDLRASGLGVILVLMLAISPAYCAGYIQGFLIDYWTGGTRHRTLAA